MQVVYEIISDGCSLENFLINGVKDREFNRKVIILKDIASYLDNPDIVAILKTACLLIEQGELDTVFIFVASSLKVPGELEKYITILEDEYLTENGDPGRNHGLYKRKQCRLRI